MNHLVIEFAITSPSPSISLNCSGVAAIIASSEPNRRASDSDAAGPKFFMPSPTRSLLRGLVFELLIAVNKLVALNSAKPSS